MVVFDLDDTLYKESGYVASGIRSIAKEVDNKGIISKQDALDIINGAPDTATGFDLLEARILLADAKSGFNVDKIVALYRTHTPDIRLSEDTLRALTYLQTAQIKIGIITDGRSLAQRAKIKALGLDRFVDDSNIIISGETGADKHTPLPFQKIANANPDETKFIYVGDNPEKDFYWPNKLGWETIMLRDINGLNIHQQHPDDFPEDHRAKFEISSLTELKNFV